VTAGACRIDFRILFTFPLWMQKKIVPLVASVILRNSLPGLNSSNALQVVLVLHYFADVTFQLTRGRYSSGVPAGRQ
jgi:hypothetical protein